MNTSFLRHSLFPVVAGLFSAFLAMMLVEGLNSVLHPFPLGIDPRNSEDMKAFINMLPMKAFLIVLCGWLLGSAIGGAVLTHLRRTQPICGTLWSVGIVSGLLGLLGAINNVIVLQNAGPVWMSAVGIPLLVAGPWIGYTLTTSCKK